VIDFYATWCPPCKKIAPRFVAMAEEFKGAMFAKVDVDINSEVS
jgi:Thioredoxin domain-containing protein